MPTRSRAVGSGRAASTRFTARTADAITVLRDAVAGAREDGVPLTAQGVAFALFLSIPASSLVILGAFSLLAEEATIDRLMEQAGALMPDAVVELLRESLRRSAANASGSGVMLAVGLALALWSTTSAASTLLEAVNRTFERPDRRGLLHRRLLALMIVVCMAISGALVLVLLVLGPHLQRWLGDTIGEPELTAWVWWSAQWPIIVLALLGAFTVVLAVAPDVERPAFRHVAPGAGVALAVWLAASSAFAVYSRRFGTYERTWGPCRRSSSCSCGYG